MALGNLLPRIREAYRAEEIDATTAKYLTLATKAQQKSWLALFDDPEGHAPWGSALKAWLFGGASISASVALFDLSAYTGQIVSDLFGEERYFADAGEFWTAQKAEIDARKACYLAHGWQGVVIVPEYEHFATWDHEHVTKNKGGRVYIDIHRNGEVTFHEGYLTRKEAQRMRTGDAGGKEVSSISSAKKPELTAPLTPYVQLHRHAAVRSELARNPSMALRVMVAHAICGSPLWSVKSAEQRDRNEGTTQSVATCPAQRALDERRTALLAMLGLDPEQESIVRGYSGSGLVELMTKLTELGDSEAFEVLAYVMAETLAVGSDLIEILGPALSVDMAHHWQADQSFYDLLRDREVMTAILAEVGGDVCAHAHTHDKGKLIKAVIADHLTGSNDRPKVDHWVPRWMAFPPTAYTERGGVATVTAAERARWLAEAEAAEPELFGDESPEHGGQDAEGRCDAEP